MTAVIAYYTSAYADATSVTVPVPTHTDGDYLVAAVDGNAYDNESSAGWSAVAGGASIQWSLRAFSRTAASEPASYVFSSNQAASEHRAFMLDVTGALGKDVVAAISFSANEDAYFSGVTTTAADDLLIGFGSVSVGVMATPAGLTLAATNSRLYMFKGAQPTADATGDFYSTTSGAWATVLLAIKSVPPPNITISAPAAISGVAATPVPSVSEHVLSPVMQSGIAIDASPLIRWRAPSPAMASGVASAAVPALRWLISAPAMQAGSATMPVPGVGAFLRISAPSMLAGTPAMPVPGVGAFLRVAAPAMVSGTALMPVPTVGTFLRVSAPAMATGSASAAAPGVRFIVGTPTAAAGAAVLPLPAVKLLIPAATLATGVPVSSAPSLRWRALSPSLTAGTATMPVPAVLVQLGVPDAITGVPQLAAPGITIAIPAQTMHPGVPVFPPPVIVANIRIFAPAMTPGLPVMWPPKVLGNNGPAIDSQVVTDALSGRYGPVHIVWRVEKRTQANQFLEDVSLGFIAGDIDADNSRAIFRNATFTVDPTLCTINPLADHVAVIADVLVHYPGNPPFPLAIESGLFALTVPQKTIGPGQQVQWKVAASDLGVHLVENTTTDTYTVAAGEDYITGANAVNAILAAHGLRTALGACGQTLPVARSWPAGTPWLTVCNALLADIVYFPLWFDRTGVARSMPMPDYSTRAPDTSYSDALWLTGDIAETTDTTRFANQIVAMVNDSSRPPLSSVATNNDPSSPISTVSLGRTITQVIQSAAPDQPTLDTAATRALQQAAWTSRQADILTQLDPRRDAHEMYALNDEAAGYDGAGWVVSTWSYSLDTPTMKHTVALVSPVAVSL